MRYPVQLECSWDREARVADISVGGCYVDCRLVPSVGRGVEFWASFNLVPLEIQGTVAYVKPGQGFGLEFGELSGDTLERLHACLIETRRRAAALRGPGA